MEEYVEFNKILIPGEFKALKFENNSLIIVDEHYSTGPIFGRVLINNLWYLKYEEGFIGLKGGKLNLIGKFEDFNSMVVLDSVNYDGTIFKIKHLEGYLDNNLNICSSGDEALVLHWIWPDIVSPSTAQILLNEFQQQNHQSEYISTDGLDIASSNKSFKMSLDASLSEHAEISDVIDHHELWYIAQISESVKFQFKNINNRIYLYNSQFGYMQRTEAEYETEVVTFSKNLPEFFITLIPTNAKGYYKLGNGKKYVQINILTCSVSSSEIVESIEEASTFQFEVIDEDHEFYN